MSKIYEFKEPKIKYSDVAKEVHDLFEKITTLYLELSNKYTDLSSAILEMKLSKDTDIDVYVPAMNKVAYLMSEIPNVLEKEEELFTQNSYLFPYLISFIRKVYDIKCDINYKEFSLFDTFVDPNYSKIKNNYIIARMIRAMDYYEEFSFYSTESILSKSYEDSDQLKDKINYRYADIEVINTMAVVKNTYEEDPSGDLIYSKFKCLFMFTNPFIEHYYLNEEEGKDHPFLVAFLEEDGLKAVKDKIVKTLIAIQQNKLINLKENEEIVNTNLTMKQAFDILFKYNNHKSPYDNRFQELKHDYDDNIEELGILLAYLQQALANVDETAINDLDHLFSEMCTNESPVKYGSIILSPKVVNHFFNKDVLLKQKQEENNRMRTREKDDNEDDDE